MQKAPLARITIVFGLGCLILAACRRDDPPPTTPGAVTQPGYPPGQPGYPPPGQPGYPPPGQPGYPPPGQPGYPPPGQPGVAPAGGQMAVPGPQALPCSSDAQCMTHKCNVQYGKCAFPCETDMDCIQGSSCLKGPLGAACIPKVPGT